MTAARKYDVILFDWDGTLVDSMPLVMAGHNLVRRAFGMPEWGLEETLANATKSARENFPILYGDRAAEADRIFYEFINQHRFDKLTPFGDIAAVMSELKSAGYKMAVVSNKKHEYLKLELSHFGWLPLFDTYVGAGVAKQDKPSAYPVHLALENIGWRGDLSRVLYVGDTATDRDTAKNSGIDWAYVHHDAPKAGVTDGYVPVWNGRNIEALSAWLKA
jgi:phosphoglycolate phosphatase